MNVLATPHPKIQWEHYKPLVGNEYVQRHTRRADAFIQ